MKEAVNRQLVATQQHMCDREADARLSMWQAFFLTDVSASTSSARSGRVLHLTVVLESHQLAMLYLGVCTRTA